MKLILRARSPSKWLWLTYREVPLMVGISFLMKSLLRECIFIKRIRRVLDIILCVLLWSFRVNYPRKCFFTYVACKSYMEQDTFVCSVSSVNHTDRAWTLDIFRSDHRTEISCSNHPYRFNFLKLCHICINWLIQLCASNSGIIYRLYLLCLLRIDKKYVNVKHMF